MNGDLVPRGIEPICGWQWIQVHRHDLDGWHPTIEISRPGSRQTITIKSKEAMKAVSENLKDLRK